ncbi:hypothetical protein RHIZO_01540 [Rhizobiaceae bacterium]|nr:hypothetical protein RHIZO_01540 [Rhizobiaceae bacterium]
MRRTDAFAVTIALLALAAPALAQAKADVPAQTPQAVPVPETRPAAADKREEPGKPEEAAPEAPPGPDGPAAPPVRETLAESDAAFSECTAALTALGARFEVRPPLTDADERDCGIARPLAVSEILAGVELRPEAVLRCATALALAEWTRDFVVPAARRLPGRGPLAGIDHGTAYLCRPRNGVEGGTLSEHAFGNAIDVAGFRFERGEALAVTPRTGDGSLEEAFQEAARKTACLAFATVLGPGADVAHADHLHLDVKARSGGFRLCQ